MKSSEAEQIVRSYAAAEDGYAQALRALIQRFESAKKVFPHLVHKMTAKEPINLTQEDFSRYQDKYARCRLHRHLAICSLSSVGKLRSQPKR